MPTFSVPSDSLVATLTDEQTPRRTFHLSQSCAVIVLSRVLRSIIKTRVDSFEELAVRREAAALVQGLRIDIERERQARSIVTSLVL